MPGWVERSLDARDEQRKIIKEQRDEDAKHLAVRVSCLLGEVFEKQGFYGEAEPSLEIKEDSIILRFMFADKQKKSLALQWRCPICSQDFLTPVSELAQVGEIVHNAQDRFSPSLPNHQGCLGKSVV